MDNRRGEWWLLAQLLLITAHLLPFWPALASFGVAIWPKPCLGWACCFWLLACFGPLRRFAVSGPAFRHCQRPSPRIS